MLWSVILLVRMTTVSVSNGRIWFGKFELRTWLNEESIKAVAKILNEWNPLGEKASAFNNLDGYYAEAIDILSCLDLYQESVKQTVGAVLSEAFEIDLEETELKHYSKRIEQMIKKH